LESILVKFIQSQLKKQITSKLLFESEMDRNTPFKEEDTFNGTEPGKAAICHGKEGLTNTMTPGQGYLLRKITK